LIKIVLIKNLWIKKSGEVESAVKGLMNLSEVFGKSILKQCMSSIFGGKSKWK